MRILAIETAGITGSVAALVDDGIMAERQLDTARRSMQTLVPALAELLDRVGWKRQEVELVAVATGPGSFTGLRIGVATAKTFAYAIGCRVAGVHTLAAVAARVPHEIARFAAVIDAQRSELFVADFRRTVDGLLMGQDTTRVMHRDAFLASLGKGDVVTGPGLAPLVDRLPRGVVAVDRALRDPTAGAVGRLARCQAEIGETVSVFELVPHYFRRTAAEEQWERKQPRPK